MNAQLYWDGNSGALEYNTRRAVLTTKPNIAVEFNTLAYSEDDHVAEKTLGGAVYQLTESEKSVIKSYIGGYNIQTPMEQSVETHNISRASHMDLRGCCSVLSTAETLSEASGALHRLSWYGCITDALGCAHRASEGFWEASKDGKIDSTIRLAFSGLIIGSQNTFTVVLKKNGTEEVTRKSIMYQANAEGVPTLEVFCTVDMLQGETLSVELQAPTTGYLVPLRSAWIIEDSGSTIGTRTHDLWYNTVGALEFTSGVQAAITKDDLGSPIVTAGTWLNTIRRL